MTYSFLNIVMAGVGVVVRSCGLVRDVLCCVVLCWFDPAMVAPRLAWLVEAVAFGGADGDVGCGMWDVGCGMWEWQFQCLHIYRSRT